MYTLRLTNSPALLVNLNSTHFVERDTRAGLSLYHYIVIYRHMNALKLSDSLYARASECLKVLAHPKRLMMLRLMADHSLPVGALAEAVAVPGNVASEHLRLLERCGLVRARREAQSKYYEIAEPHVLQLLECLESRFSEA